MSNLSSDIWPIVARYLCYVDKYSLKLVSKKMHKIKLDFKPIVINKLGKIIDNADEFCNKLHQYKCIMSGSFILSCLYDEDYFNDVDLFDKEIAQSFENNASHRNGFSEYLYKNGKYPYEFKPYEEAYVIRNFNFCGTKIQHICSLIDPVKYIDLTFDMDICKSYFDGEKLYVKSWDKLFNRKDYIKPNGLLMQYYSKNVHVENLCRDRIEKYRLRGFDIQYHPEYDKIKQYIKEKINERMTEKMNLKMNEKINEKDIGFFKHIGNFYVDLSIY